jgi:hypothetical protein
MSERWAAAVVLLGALCAACGSSPKTAGGAAGSDGRAPDVGGQAGVADVTSEPPDASDAADGSGGASATSDGGDDDAPDAGGAAGATPPITAIAPTIGCGQDPRQPAGVSLASTIYTNGVKAATCADSRCGPWGYVRQYVLTLPTGYDPNKAYPLVFEGTGCGGNGLGVYPLTFSGAAGTSAPNVANTVIRVGLTPPPNDIGHARNPLQGCYDDREGDDSVEWAFYEDLYDRLAGTLCFDRNRVFAAGNRNGGTLANELGCKYAGDDARPIRGVLSNGGAWPTDPKAMPTCSGRPMAGMWVDQTFDPGGSGGAFADLKTAVTRAMMVNGCIIGTSFDEARLVSFPIGGSNGVDTCQKVVGCPDLDPIVVCAIPGNQSGGNDNVVNPGFSTFINLFDFAPLLTP